MRKIPIALIAGAIALTSCNDRQEENTEQSNETEKESSNTKKQVEEEKEEVHVPKVNIDSLIEALNQSRIDIENNLEGLKKTAIKTDKLREQVKQKWSQIDFYKDGDKLKRIKTYPHEGISTRTEEFYFNDAGDLTSVVIEDEGAGKKGGNEEGKDKIYYFHNNQQVAEVNESGETEYTIKHSDGERLLQEAKEYIQLAQ